MTSTRTSTRRHRGRGLALVVVAALTLAACGSSDSDSGSKSTTTTVSKADRKATASICRAAVTAAAAASDDLSSLANAHIQAFNTAIDALEAWEGGDQATFDAKAAEFRAFAANEKNQTARIENDKQSVARTETACRKALDGTEMVAVCEEAVALLADHRAHALEVIAAGDALYAAGEQLLAGIEADNESMVEAAASQINVAGTQLDTALADDTAKFDAADAAVTRCDESGRTTVSEQTLR